VLAATATLRGWVTAGEKPMNIKPMNIVRRTLGILAVTTLVATAASAQAVGSERDSVAPQNSADRAGSNVRHPTKSTRSVAGPRGSGAYASAPARSPSARARAATNAFDGDWSVVIVTQSGACDRAYRYGVQISNGDVLNAGSESVSLDGHVAPNGAIQVSVAAGGQEAYGTGRLSRVAGHGTWRGMGSGGSCAGTWEAERRE
jgi:hypothetical protein